MRRFIIIIFIFAGLLNFTACQYDKDAKLTVTEKIPGRTDTGKYFLKVSVKNSGGQPAFMVVIIASALNNGKEIAYKERAIGDIYVDQTVTDTLFFDDITFIEPDSFKLTLTYTPYNLMN
ncbi:MAG: hypothetical protein WCR42_14905 [bacterium]